ncbi:SDR family oxidoreductase [Streptomyces somaliensis]|uniref:SDR family NAD(P)-dependent oxidoreductase n=1 Tax=Streptomyces somaliensis TaxID=78355 RepID=UPI0020CBEBB4|nr:SDR family oxidoreductase [Streptomyces somaliensis]MCP9946989.1 SDR family oxidoreductase [Streptomyces somaliensis]MCP9963626.1 SDR family oxidoreductase [Streptomyces somaliensis]MCP9976050.1 SDR family oxidoreductase [Streptomyces somaliensis]
MGSSGVRVDLRGGQALVTGGARGLGAAIVRRLAGAGASVLVADVRKELARELCDELNGDGGDACFVELDVRDPDAVAGVFRELDGVGRAVDVLVNNAAVDVSKPIEHLTADEVTRVVQTNLLGPVYLCLEAYRRMVARGGGHIVNILSTAANRTWTEAARTRRARRGYGRSPTRCSRKRSATARASA